MGASIGHRWRQVEQARPSILLVGAALQLVGCAYQPPAPLKEPATANACQEREEVIARLRILLDEKAAEVETLRRHQTVQERKLDDANKEVVRAQSKLIRLASEPDAAAAQAEAEIALRSLRERFNATAFQPEIFQAQRLLAASGEAFQGGDYAHAVELAGEAKKFIALADDRLTTPLRMSAPADETAFQATVRLRVMVRSNLRAQPSRASYRVAVLEPNAFVLARAFRGRWVRVQTEDGREGWVFHSLLETP